jgi:hypothetical protein
MKKISAPNTALRNLPEKQPMADALQIRARVLKVSNDLWRELLVPADLTFHELHACLQLAFGLDGYYHYQFSLNQRRHFVHPALMESDEGSRTTIDAHHARIGDELQRPGARVLYQFDSDTPWEIELSVVDIRHGFSGNQPVCIAGNGAGLIDDCGGPEGFEELLEILSDPTHPDYLSRRIALGREYDAEAFDAEATTSAMAVTRVLARNLDDEFDAEFSRSLDDEFDAESELALVDRFALVVRPGERYRAWLMEKGLAEAGSINFRSEHDRAWVFLLPEFDSIEKALAFVQADFTNVLYSHLLMAFGPESEWPQPFDWSTFTRYFDVTVESQVFEWPV